MKTKTDIKFSKFSLVIIAIAIFAVFSFFQVEKVSADETSNFSPTDTSEVAKASVGDGSICSGFVKFFAHPVNCTLIPILSFSGQLLTISATIFNMVIDAKSLTNTISNPVIYTIWALVRDVLNIGFIMVLLFSAFCTVFQIEQYSYRKILLTLIIMALLVNFSFPIARFIIDFSNVLMYYFLNNLPFGTGYTASTLFSNIAGQSGLGTLLSPTSADVDTSYLIAAIIFTFIMAVTLLMIGILLIVRTIALALVIIFSPIAFTGSIIPVFSKYASQWWGYLFKYSFFGPIMVFMLFVSVRMMTEINKATNGTFKTLAKGQTIENSNFVAAAAFYAIPIVILWLGIGVAQSMSIAGAGAVTGQGKKFMGWAGRNLTGYRAGKWGTKKLIGKEGKVEQAMARNKYLRWLSPTAFQKAWEERSADNKRKAFAPATGGWRDTINRVMSLGKEKTRFKEAALENNILTKEKELKDVNQDSDYLSDEFNKATEAKDTEKMSAILRILANNNDINDFMANQGEVMDPTNVREFIYEKLIGAGMKKSEAAKQLSDVGEIAFNKGNFQLFGMAKFNKDLGGYEKNEDEEQIKSAIGKASNIKAQTKNDIWHWNSFLKQNTDGTTGNLHAIGLKQLEALTPSELGQLNRARKDFFDRMSEHLTEIKAHAKNIRAEGNTTQADIIDEFARRINGFKNDPQFNPNEKVKKEIEKEEKNNQSTILDQHGRPYKK